MPPRMARLSTMQAPARRLTACMPPYYSDTKIYACLGMLTLAVATSAFSYAAWLPSAGRTRSPSLPT